MNCPYCNSPVLLNDWAGNHWYKCGTTKTFRSESCVDREPVATELRNALARIKRLEEFASRFLNPDDLGWAIGKYDRDEAREALGKERVESK